MGHVTPKNAIDKASRAFLAFNAMIFIGLGVRGLLEPAAHMAGFGLTDPGLMLLGEIRANYGGMHIGMGLMFMMFCAGLVFGRLVSWSADGRPSDFVMQLLIIEILASLIAAGLLAALNRQPT